MSFKDRMRIIVGSARAMLSRTAQVLGGLRKKGRAMLSRGKPLILLIARFLRACWSRRGALLQGSRRMLFLVVAALRWAREQFGKTLCSLATSRFTAIIAFLVICALFLGTAWITGQRVGGPAAKALEELFIGWLPGSQISAIREVQERVLLGSFQRGLIDLTRDGMKWLFVAITAISCIRWGRRCVHIIGTGDKPAYGILTRAGKAIDVLGPGGIVFALRPIEGLFKVPTSQYRMSYQLGNGLYSMGEGERSPQPLSVKIGVYFSFPEINTEYKIPGSEDGVMGRTLLLGLFYKLPGQVNLWDTADGFVPFLQDAVLGAVRQVLSEHHHEYARTKKEEIEAEIKEYLVSETANPFLELGIPPVCIDVEITSIELRASRTPAEEAFGSPELARRHAETVKIEADGLADARRVQAQAEADATRIEAEGEAAAAEDLRIAAAEQLAAYTGAGVSADVAALVISRGAGEGTPVPGIADRLGDLMVLERLGSPASPVNRRQGRRRPQRGRQQGNQNRPS